MKNIINIALASIILSFNFAIAETAHHEAKNMPILAIKPSFIKYEASTMYFTISDSTANKPLSLNDFEEIHTRRLHSFVISDDLEYYKHIHPEETTTKGLYRVKWKEYEKNKSYRVWIDVIPLKTKENIFAWFDLKGKESTSIKKTYNTKFTLDNGVNLNLFFSEKPQIGKDITMKVTFKDNANKPFTKLEEIMGAFAHAVGFTNSNRNILHIHPVKPKNTVSELEFHVKFKDEGYVKMFVQIKIEGKEYFIPFGFDVGGISK
jgi:hypothetical protein